jgi:hypothetical protein
MKGGTHQQFGTSNTKSDPLGPSSSINLLSPPTRNPKEYFGMDVSGAGRVSSFIQQHQRIHLQNYIALIKYLRSGAVAQACTLSYFGGGLRPAWAKICWTPISTSGWIGSAHLLSSAAWGSTNRRVTIQASPGIKNVTPNLRNNQHTDSGLVQGLAE